MSTEPESPTPVNPAPPTPPNPPASPEEEEAQENRQMMVAIKMVGSAMVFIGFLQVFLSASTGASINSFPMMIYFSGMALWAYSAVEIPMVRYGVIGLSILCALAFTQVEHVLFWHKYLIYWGTIGLVVFFMFKPQKKPAE